MTSRVESISNDPSFVATFLGDGSPSGILSLFICRVVVEGLSGSSTSFSGTLSPRILDRGSSPIILDRPYPEGSSHDVVTSLGSVESGACASSRVPRRLPLDTLADEKSLTTIWSANSGVLTFP